MSANDTSGKAHTEHHHLVLVLGETFAVLAEMADSLAEHLRDVHAKDDVSTLMAAEALARQMGAVSDTAAVHCGCKPHCGGLQTGAGIDWFLPPDLRSLLILANGLNLSDAQCRASAAGAAQEGGAA